jgi:predicted RNA binding protein YcfA (HicA-like mRNA interferase family)
MSGKDKLYHRIMTGPIPTNITYKEIRLFLIQNGFTELGHAKSSHHIFRHSGSRYHINIPAHNEGDMIKRGYISNVRKIVILVENKGA